MNSLNGPLSYNPEFNYAGYDSTAFEVWKNICITKI